MMIYNKKILLMIYILFVLIFYIKSLTISTSVSTLKFLLQSQSQSQSLNDGNHDNIENSIIKVNGMTCGSCANNVKKTILQLNGIHNVDVNLLGNYCKIEYNNRKININDIYKYLCDRLSFKFTLVNNNNKTLTLLRENANQSIKTCKQLKNLLLISLLLSIPNSILNIIGHNNNIISSTLALIAYSLMVVLTRISLTTIPLIIHTGIITSFISGCIKLFNSNNLHSCSASHDFETTTMMISSFILGRYLDSRAKKNTNDLLGRISNFLPSTAKKIISINPSSIDINDNNDDVIIEVPTEILSKDDFCFLRPNDKIPADGYIIKSSDLTIDESNLTGEFAPVRKKLFDECFASTTVLSGNAIFKVSSCDDETSVGKISSIVADNMIKNESNLKSKIDRISEKFFPAIIGYSIFITAIWYYLLKYKDIMNVAEVVARGGPFLVALNQGLSVLVIACPCALTLAIPAAITVAVSIAARNNIILKGSKFLDNPRIDTFVFDKTGTLTYGDLEVLSYQRYSSSFTESDIFHMISTIESYSKNKIGNVLVKYFEKRKTDMINWNIITDTVRVESNGLSAEFIDSISNTKKVTVSIGAESYFTNTTTILPETLSSIRDSQLAGSTVLLVTINYQLSCIVTLGDRIRKDAKETIKYLQENKMECWIASGDHQVSVEYIGSQLNIPEKTKGGLKPEEKVKFIKELKSKSGSSIAFVGDGFNDAPALSQADLGIAMSSGVDLSLHTASIILQSNSLMLVSKVYELLVLTSKTIKSNLIFAVIYNLLALPIASGVFYRYGVLLNPSLCSLFMALSSMSVMATSLDMPRRFEMICRKKKLI